MDHFLPHVPIRNRKQSWLLESDFHFTCTEKIASPCAAVFRPLMEIRGVPKVYDCVISRYNEEETKTLIS